MSNWHDLKARVLSAIVLLVVAEIAVYFGGITYVVFIFAVVGLMLWEALRMGVPSNAMMVFTIPLMGLLTLGALRFGSPMLSGPLIGALFLLIHGTLTRDRGPLAVYSIAIVLAGGGFLSLRLDAGIMALVWLIAIVVVTDVAGYFAGRMIGGPKFWPRISPKKTWSGTVAGWIGAVIISYLIFPDLAVAGVAILVSFASQAGDIAESALKRRAGVKDSSSLIPGHGGFLDRFDGMIGAAMLVKLATLIGLAPAGLS